MPINPTMPAPNRSIMTSSGIGNRLRVKMLKLKASAFLTNIYKGDIPSKRKSIFNFLNPSKYCFINSGSILA